MIWPPFLVMLHTVSISEFLCCPPLFLLYLLYIQCVQKVWSILNITKIIVLSKKQFKYDSMKILGVALQDSPVGFAAYMLEKFITWTNPNFNKMTNGGILQKYSYTQLLDNIMIYWLTNSITTSMRIYAESVSIAHRRLEAERQV